VRPSPLSRGDGRLLAAAAEAVRRLYDAHNLPQPSPDCLDGFAPRLIYAAAVIGQLTEQLLNQLWRHQLRNQLEAGGLCRWRGSR
jgi:hypothetical protein